MALVRDIVPVPRETFVSPRTEELLDSIPSFERRSTDIQATLDAIAAELDRLEARRQQVLDNFFPQTADEFLGIIEAQLGLAVNPPDKTLAQRRATAQAFLQNRSHAGEGSSWVDSMNRLLGTGWSYEEYIPPADRQANLVEVPSFETTSAQWYSFTTAIRNTDWSKYGSWSLHVINDGTSDFFGINNSAGGFHISGIDAGDDYVARVDVNIVEAAGPGFRLSVEWFNASGDSLGTTSGAPVATVGEHVATVQSQAPAGAAHAVLTFYTLGGGPAGAGEFYVDGFMLTKGTTVPNYRDGSSAGWEWLGTPQESASRAVENVPPNTIRVLMPYSQALAEPALPTATAGAGSMAAGTYHYVVTARNFYGETMASPQVDITVGASAGVTLDWADVPGATGYRVYRATGSGVLERLASPTASTYVDDGTVAPDPLFHPPGSNTTQSPQASAAKQLARQFTHAHIELEFGYVAGFLFDVSRFGDVM